MPTSSYSILKQERRQPWYSSFRRKQEILPFIQIIKCHIELLKVKERLDLDIQIPGQLLKQDCLYRCICDCVHVYIGEGCWLAADYVT